MLLCVLLTQNLAFGDPDAYPTINAQSFRPAIDSHSFSWVNESTPGINRTATVRSVVSYNSKPLVYTSYDDIQTELLSSVTQLNLITGYTLGSFRFAADIPIVLQADGSLPNGDSLSETSLGDVTLDVKYSITPPENNVGVALTIRSTLPSSTGTVSLGSKSPIVEGELSSTFERERWILAVNVGHRHQSNWVHEHGVFGSQFFWRGGMGWKYNPQLGTSIEFVSSHLYKTNEYSSGNSSETVLTNWYSLDEVRIKAGVGFGIGKGIGTPDWRGIVGVEYRPKPKPKDSDADSITDDVDACPHVPEDRDGVQDTDGCPDPTEVTILFVDASGERIDGQSWTAGEREGTSGTPFQSQAGTFQLKATIEGYRPIEQSIAIPDGEPVTLTIKIEKILGQLSVVPTDEAGKPLKDLVWVVGDDNVRRTQDDIASLPPGQYEVHATAPGFKSVTKKASITPNETVTLAITMQPTKAEIKDGRINFEGVIHFKTNSAIIEPRSFGLLNDIGDIMRDFLAIEKIRIEGHTDSRGSDIKNKRLSQDRAESVRQYLIQYNIAPERMLAEGFGEERPISDNKSKKGRQANRRVEIHILKVDKSKIKGIHDIQLQSDIKEDQELDTPR
ncbi:MAG: OmpA family protein [Myxococcota bacterium]|nr:OmpA family protein [Myxococcota bacterium]